MQDDSFSMKVGKSVSNNKNVKVKKQYELCMALSLKQDLIFLI